ncbi:Uncharacterized protein APZ42_005192, partial [Daphnia magna]
QGPWFDSQEVPGVLGFQPSQVSTFHVASRVEKLPHYECVFCFLDTLQRSLTAGILCRRSPYILLDQY